MGRKHLSSIMGFTLMEVMISLAIFAIIGIASVKQIRLIADTKKTALGELDLYNAARTTISLIRYDLSQAFHIRYDDLGPAVRQALQRNERVAHTLFDGRKNELVFTTLSHRVYYAGLKESEQTEISYFLQKMDKGKNFTFMKREAPLIDDDLYQGGTIYRLLENVEKVSFQYWDKKTQRWYDDWNSDGRQFRDQFPLAVKMKLTVLKEDKPPLEVETEFKVAFPNNDQYTAKF